MHRRPLSVLLATVVLGAAPLAAQDSSLAAPGTFVLRAAHLIDGTGAAEINNAAIVVVGDSITWVGSAANVKAPAGARTRDQTRTCCSRHWHPRQGNNKRLPHGSAGSDK